VEFWPWRRGRLQSLMWLFALAAALLLMSVGTLRRAQQVAFSLRR
jgi:hypothetical protein